MTKKLLIIEDEKAIAKQMKWGLADDYDVFIESDVDQARRLIAARSFPVITLDLGLEPEPNTPREGFRLLEDIPNLAPHTRVVVITGNTETENAVKSIGLGAADFCTKPIELDLLKIILDRTYRIYELEAANRNLLETSKDASAMCGMIGVSGAMKKVFELIRQVSRTDYPIFIQGESGTGKEMASTAAHSLSRRADKPLIILNCAAIPENLLESELFGHEKGAFTGAAAKKIGKFEQADGGTLFLDEIGDMPHDLQAKILRFLQEGTFERVGGNKTMKLDVRIIAATNVDISKAIADGRFREDLFYRLNVVPIVMPPLKDRQEDILVLANHFIQEESKHLKGGQVKLSQLAAAALTSHSWPGNVRELQNRIRRAMATAADGVITPASLGFSDEKACSAAGKQFTLKEARENAEIRAIRQAMEITGNNITQAAKLLDVSRPTMHDLLKKHGIG